MRRRTYIETLVDFLEANADTKNMDYREKLEAILDTYKGMFNYLSARLSPKEAMENITIQEGGVLIYFLTGFLKGKFNVYKIAENFGNHLHKTNLDIPLSVIPNRMDYKHSDYQDYLADRVSYEDIQKKMPATLIEFPNSMEFTGRDGEKYHNCIVMNGIGPKGSSLQIVSIDSNSVEQEATVVVMDIGSDFKTIEEAIDYHCENYDELIFPREMVRFVIKCLLYIESGEPDLKREGLLAKTRKAKKHRSFRHGEFFPYPIVRVGYSFHNKRWHVDSTMVSGHFRWQPYGPGLKQVKLIWIEEHERKYK